MEQDALTEEEFLDGCDLDFGVDPTPDDEADLFVLFAEALDDRNPKTTAEVESEWKAMFGAGA